MNLNNKAERTDSFRLQPPPSVNSGSGSIRQSRGRRTKTRAGLDLETLESSSETQSTSLSRENSIIKDEFHKKSEVLFQKLNPENGLVGSQSLISVFQSSGLSNEQLAKIWSLSDTESKGSLDLLQFKLSLNLIYKAQNGLPLTSNKNDEMKLPKLNIQSTSSNSVPTSIKSSSTVSSPPPLNSANQSIWRISIEDQEKYTNLFYDLDPDGQYLDANKARKAFLDTGVDVSILAKIWTLADGADRGKLICAEFLVAMHLISLIKNKKITTLPSRVPFELAKSASEALSDVPQPSSMDLLTPEKDDWKVDQDILDSIKESFKSLPKTDSDGISSEECVKFFLNSNLPQTTLAKVWELASYRGQTELNFSEFAIAMTLIRKVLNGTPLPNSLPSSLDTLKYIKMEPEDSVPNIPEPTFDISELDVIYKESHVQLLPQLTKDESQYTQAYYDELSKKLIDLKETYETELLSIQEMEKKLPMDESLIESSISQLKSIMKEEHIIEVEQQKIYKKLQKLETESNNMDTELQHELDEVNELKAQLDKLEKNSKIDLGFLEFNLGNAKNTYDELVQLLQSLGEPAPAKPAFLS